MGWRDRKSSFDYSIGYKGRGGVLLHPNFVFICKVLWVGSFEKGSPFLMESLKMQGAGWK